MVGIPAGGGTGGRRPIHGDRRAADGAVVVGAQPGVDARSMEAVIARAELLHLVVFPEPRQANRALPLRLLPELHFLHRNGRVSGRCGANLSGGAPAAAPEVGDRGWALHGENEDVDEEGDGDDSDEAEDELERG